MKRVICVLWMLLPLLLQHGNAIAQTKTAMVAEKYSELPLGAVKANGWLQHQLQIMAAGTTGHLDEVYDKVKNDNGWLGGKGDGWEETPYWLDGAVPLAYLLNDEALKKKVSQYINWTLDNQRPSGYFGPITKWERETGKKITVNDCDKGEDWWPKMVMLKVLQQYYNATSDARVLPFMSKFFKYQLQTLRVCPIKKWTEWSNSRGHDNSMMVQWLYLKTKEPFLPELAALVASQTFEWSKWFAERDWVINAAVHQNDEFWMARHGVNVAMAIKTPAIDYQRTGDTKYLKALKTGFNDLMTLHGLPMGIFSADEDLHGNSPVQGVELCAVVEAMYALEKIVGITADPHYMDALERMTFNALPTQTTDDYNCKQYYQVANQVHIKKGTFDFSWPFDRGMTNVLGMRSGYTCCLANMHQGWTKFTSHLWYATPGNGIAALHFAPSTVTATLGSAKTAVTIQQQTSYPFDGKIDFNFSMKGKAGFPFHVRIPGWSKQAVILINGVEYKKAAGGQVLVINREWKNGDIVSVDFAMEVTVSNWGKNSRAIERGPLVYALKLNERWEKKNDAEEGDYFELYTDDAWNYGIVSDILKDPTQQVTVQPLKPVTDNFIWNLANAPIQLQLRAKKIPGWVISDDVAQQPVSDRFGHYRGKTADAIETISLVPYGCTKLRIVAFPIVK